MLSQFLVIVKVGLADRAMGGGAYVKLAYVLFDLGDGLEASNRSVFPTEEVLRVVSFVEWTGE